MYLTRAEFLALVAVYCMPTVLVVVAGQLLYLLGVRGPTCRLRTAIGGASVTLFCGMSGGVALWIAVPELGPIFANAFRVGVPIIHPASFLAAVFSAWVGCRIIGAKSKVDGRRGGEEGGRERTKER